MFKWNCVCAHVFKVREVRANINLFFILLGSVVWFCCAALSCFYLFIFVLFCFVFVLFPREATNSNSRRESSNNSITISSSSSNKNKKNREKTTKHSYVHEEVCIFVRYRLLRSPAMNTYYARRSLHVKWQRNWNDIHSKQINFSV